MAVKTFSAGEQLTASDTNTYLNNGGLVYVAETSFATSTNPFINGCFSSSFENYRVLMNFRTSASTNVRMRFRYGTSTTDSTATYDRYGVTITNGVNTGENSGSQTSYYIVGTYADTNAIIPVGMDIYGPNVARNTVCQSQSWNNNSGALQFLTIRTANTTQYTGLELFLDSGNMTGTIRVYGYRQA